MNVKLAHMADIKQSGGLTHRFVFFEYTTILNGHVPAAKSDKARTLRSMEIVKWNLKVGSHEL